jgi:hypothetical protein
MSIVQCGACFAPAPPETWNGGRAPCPACGKPVEAYVFPAFSRPLEGARPEQVVTEVEAGCYHHPQNRAVVHCDECGRFLCRLCDLEVDGRHLCPGCLESGMRKRRIRDTDNRRVMYDSLALALATLPLPTLWGPVFGAPAALYFVGRHWSTPLSIVPRTRVRFVLAAVIALLQLAGIGFLIYLALRVAAMR